MKSFFYIAFSALALGALFPYFTTGYYSDDAFNSVLVAHLKNEHQTLWQFIQAQNHSWMFDSGRLFPLAVATTYSLWYGLPQLATYRYLQVGLVVSNLFLFMAVIRSLGGERKLAWLSALGVLAVFQLRDYHDPIAGYAFLMQIAFLLGMGAIALFSRYLRKLNSTSLIGSLILYACALLYYETAITFLPVLLFLAFRPPTLRFMARWGHLLLTCTYLLGVAYLRLGSALAYNGMRSQLGPQAVLTFFRQLSGAFPVIYSVFGKSGFYTFGTLLSHEFLTPSTLALQVCGTWLFYFALRSPREERSATLDNNWGLWILGGSLLFIPTFLVAISLKYQEGINRPGMAYLPVYLSYFGLALLAATRLLHTRHPKRISLGFGMLLAFAFGTNQIAAARLNEYWRYPRDALTRAIRAGLFSHLEPGAQVLLPVNWDWARADFFLEAFGEKPSIQFLTTPPHAAFGNFYTLKMDDVADGQGRVTLTPAACNSSPFKTQCVPAPLREGVSAPACGSSRCIHR